MNVKTCSNRIRRRAGLFGGLARDQRRRGAVAVQVAVMMTVMAGFAALSVDLGAIYNTRAELQRSADAAALAAASLLSEYDEEESPLDLARAEATRIAASNTVQGRAMVLDSNTDVVFGRANYNANNNTYSFTPTEVIPDAVKVTVRMTENSPNGPMSLFFAGVVGRHTANVSAEAIAMLVPRDIALVADLSRSHRDDSQLENYENRPLNIHEVWDAMPGGIDDSPDDWAGLGYSADDDQAAGGAWGIMRYLGWGTMDVDTDYDPTADSGLIRLNTSSWSDSTLTAYLSSFQGYGYSSSERTAITSSSYGSTYKYRVAVAMGLARWNSGKSGGLWSSLGISSSSTGDGDNKIESGEITWVETIGNRTASESQTIFYDYIDNYMNQTYSALNWADSNFKYRFGAKTFMNYLQDKQQSYEDMPEFVNVPQQPMQAVKDAASRLGTTLTALDTDDQLSLEVYDNEGRHEVDLTTDFAEVTDRLNNMMAAHYEIYTNIGGGIDKAIDELTSVRARGSAKKVIFLLTDGYANVNSSGTTGDYAGGQSYALAKAQEAADLGIRIFAVTVGADSDTSLMQQIAEIGDGVHFDASGTIDEYGEELDAIFNQLGGARPVELIK